MTRNFHNLAIPVPEGWEQEVTVSVSGADTLRLTPKAPPGCVLVFLPEVNLPSVDPEETLLAFIAGHTDGRTAEAASDLRLGTTDHGLFFAMREVCSRGGPEDLWHCMYWALGNGERVQCFVVSASSKAGYDALLPQVGPLVDAVCWR